MSVSYDMYNGIDTSSVSSISSNAKSEINSLKSKIDTFSSSLSDDIWIASSKSKLTSALSKIDSEILSKLESTFNDIDSALSAINDYNSNREAALKNKEILNENKNKENVDLTSVENAIEEQEKAMQNAINKVNGICGG